MLIAPLLLGLALAAPIEDLPKRADAVTMTTTQAMGWAQLFGLGGNTKSVQNAAIAAPTTTPVAVVAPTQAPTVVIITSTLGAANLPAASNTPVAANTQVAVNNANAGSPLTPQAQPAAGSTTNKNGGFWSSLLSMFDGGNLNGALVASQPVASSAPAAAPAAPATPATTAAPAASSSGGWFSNLLGSFFGSSSSSAPAAPAAAPATTSSLAYIAPSSSQIAYTSVSAVNSQVSSSALFGFGSQSSSTSAADQPGFTGQVSVIGAGGPTGSAPTGSASPKSGLNSQVQTVISYAEEGAGITYSPYTKSGLCKTSSEVSDDIQKLLAFGIIRLYSVDCSGIQNVLAAMSSNQKLFLGIWDINNVSTDLPSMAQQVQTSKRGWSAVHTVAIGNEVVNSGRGTPAQVANAVNAAKSWFQSNAPNYSGPIVCVDTLAAVMANPQAMCDIGDYLAVNCHPYFSGVEASTSGTWLKSQVSLLLQTCGGNRQILVTESGWPTYGNTVGQSVPSLQNQLLSIKSLGQVMGSQVIMFTMYNDYWKAPGPWNVEQHWGIFGDPSA